MPYNADFDPEALYDESPEVDEDTESNDGLPPEDLIVEPYHPDPHGEWADYEYTAPGC